MLVALSGRNQLRGVVEEVRTDGLMAQIRLRIGDQALTAVITRDAVDSLRLKRGDEALAIIKSTEVMIARESPSSIGDRPTSIGHRRVVTIDDGRSPIADLVSEVPASREHHRQPVLVGGGDHIGVAHRSAGLNDCRRARCGHGVEPIPKWKKRV